MYKTPVNDHEGKAHGIYMPRAFLIGVVARGNVISVRAVVTGGLKQSELL